MEIKKVTDYLETMCNMFPEVNPKDIERILTFGWKSYYLHNSYGGDILIKDNDFWSYVGTLRNNSLEHFNYYVNKLVIKIRVLYKRRKIKWDGYYYFALSQKQYDEYLAQKKRRGRPKKHFHYGKLLLYKVYEECRVAEHSKQYIFRVPYIDDFGNRIFQEDYYSDRAELIESREPLTFQDILVTNNNYEVI